jgi:hypothetical protein
MTAHLKSPQIHVTNPRNPKTNRSTLATSPKWHITSPILIKTINTPPVYHGKIILNIHFTAIDGFEFSRI